MRVAAILLNYNSADDCRKCVSTLRTQKDVELEVVIVDNASCTREAEAVKRLCAEEGLTFIDAGENKGYNAGNNVGLRYAAEKGYPLVLVANPDMEFPDTEYVSTLADEIMKRPDVVAIGSDVVTPQGVHQNPKVRGTESWTHSFAWIGDLLKGRNFAGSGQGSVPSWVDNPKESHYCRCLNGCCLMIRTDFLKEIGFFDERTFLYGEEPIFGRRVELAGKRMYYYAGVTCVHDHKKSREGSPEFCNRHWRHSQILYIRHYSGQPFYGRWLAELSSRTYFFLLNLKHRLKR
ncbi:MAG: glycosyltransferase family 2 protein [Muribaculaceae bacterium]|nr:glycosyltransferase family 2 protein [Muribaculaceae bacterium]